MRMKLVVSLVFASVFFTSCQITENVYLEENGAGKIAFDVDASQLMAIGGSQFTDAGMTDIDSVFAFKDFLDQKKDSIAQLSLVEQQRLKKLENLSMDMKMSTTTKVFQVSVFGNFKKADDIQDMMAATNTIKNIDKKAADADNPFGGIMEKSNNIEVKYAYDGKVFKRISKTKNPKFQVKDQDSTGMMKMMFASSQYTMNYHFPHKIKSVSDPAAVFSADRKTVTIPYTLSDYFDSPEKMSFDVVLEK